VRSWRSRAHAAGHEALGLPAEERTCHLSQTVAELGSLTWQEAETLLKRRPVGLLPVGATEAHGPHLPLNTDVVIAREMARRGGYLIAESGVPVILLPEISYGVSFVGTCFGGTSPVAAESFEAHLVSVLHNLGTQGYRAICVCNAHLEPPHVDAIQRAIAVASQATGVPMLAPDKRQEPWANRLGDEFRRGARHAGGYETSLLLAAAPQEVRWNLAEQLPPVWVDLPARLRAGARTFAEAGGTLGYFGNPAGASAAEGEALFDALATIVYDAVTKAIR
jgi:creatinine amidohydrolase